MSEPRKRSLLYRLRAPIISAVFTLVLVLGTEGALRLAGLGAPGDESRLGYQKIHLPVLEPRELDDGTPVLCTHDSRLPVQCVLRDKPENSLRVYTFGGSATAGLGYSPNVTFARHLERMLKQACPDRAVEVINLGIVALSAKQVKQLVGDIAAHGDPDLMVVYSGNNEFLEIHAAKYARATSGFVGGLLETLHDSNTWRLLSRLVKKKQQRTSTVAEQEFSNDDLRQTQDQIIAHIKMEPEEIEDILTGYEKNIDSIARVAQETQVPMILMAVGSNWEWRGRKDLEEGWLEELVPGGSLEEALATINARLQEAEPDDRHEWLFQRAVVHERLSEFDLARADYREAMNVDPHLRRALDVMNDRVAAVAERKQLPYIDTVELLSRTARNGVVGFAEYYDYVHFTPRGVVLVAGEIFRRMQSEGVMQPDAAFQVDAYVNARLAETRAEDSLEVYEWFGSGDALENVHDRDLWKYERVLKELDARIEAEPTDTRALVYRGNSRFFLLGGRAGAEADYRAALELDPELQAVRDNLEHVQSDLPKLH